MGNKTIKNKELKKRIVTISYKLGLSHIGSCLTAVDIIKEIYDTKKPSEDFVLSSGHAHLAHAVVMEKYYDWSRNDSVEDLIKDYGIHCDRRAGCDASTGSLGHGVAISCGLALANRNTNVYTLVSDGEIQEGVFWETLRIAKENNLNNLKIYANFNGWQAYKKADLNYLERCIEAFGFPVKIYRTNVDYLPFLKDQIGHYLILNEEQYKYAINKLE